MAQVPATRWQQGDMIDYTPAAAVSAGDVVVIGDMVCVAVADIAAGVLGAVAVQGVFKFPKKTGAVTNGDAVYWDITGDPNTGTSGSGAATTSGASNLLIGPAVAAAGSSDDYVYALLSPNKDGNLTFAAVAAATAVTNTTTETDFDQSITLPANTLKAGDVIRVRAQAIATATNSTDTVNYKLKLGSTTILATGAVDATNNDIGYIEADIVIRTAGASGTMVAAGSTANGAVGTVTAKPAYLASTAVDTTAALAVKVSATWSAASASDSCRLDVLNVQILRK